MSPQITSSRRFHIDTDSPADFLKQISEQLPKITFGSSPFHIEADTATDFLRQVGEQISKISANSISREQEFDLTGLSQEEYEEVSRQVYERVENYCAAAKALAQRLFCSMAVVDWDYEDDGENQFSPFMADVARLKFAKTLRKVRRSFDSFDTWGGTCPFDNDELQRITQWLRAVRTYSDVEKIYHRELKSMTRDEAEFLLNMAYYELADKRDKDIEERLKVIDQEAGKNNFFSTLMRTQGFCYYSDLMLQLLVEGEFRNVQDILLISPGQMLYIPSIKRGTILCEHKDAPNFGWFDAASIDDAVNKFKAEVGKSLKKFKTLQSA